MAEEAGKKNHKKLIIGICSAVVVLAIVAVVLVLVLKPGGVFGGIGDDYFVSDDTKYVLTLEQSESFMDEEHSPQKSHVVYYYENDKVTGMSVFYEYSSEALAKSAYDYFNESEKDIFDVEEVNLRGKYLEIIMKGETFEDITVEEVRQNIEFMEMLKNMDNEDSEDVIEYDDEVEEDETESTDYGIEDNEEGVEEDF